MKVTKTKVSKKTSESLGVSQKGNNITFTAQYPNASAVHIAGDFNNWQPEKNPMSKTSNGLWQTKIKLSKGVYKYRFVVDGQWQHDPNNPATEPNPYGDSNSVLTVS